MPRASFDPAPVLKTLKDFQRRTVDHVFKRLYTDKTAGRRFLVADEVGLGKTLVARGVVAKAIAHLEQDPTIDRVDIVYICSNAAIAQQNVNRLNVTGETGAALASRLTLLPLELEGLDKRKLNFVSFTPNTTFDLKRSTGRWEERRLLYRVLRRKSSLDKKGLMKLLRCDVQEQRWRSYLAEPIKFDQSIIRDFLTRVGKDRELMEELQTLCRRFKRRAIAERPYIRKRRNNVIGQLRRLLASSCVEALEPDLIILDEFQRFKDLLKPEESDAGELAHALMDYKDARVLLLSATPYRMLSLYGEEEDHYEDFLDTLRFLLQDETKLNQIKHDFEEFREALYTDLERARAIRDRLRYRLMRVMVRTERIPATQGRDAMLAEPRVTTRLEAADIQRAKALDGVVTAVGARDAIEYWKSAPYLLNFMKDYELKRRLDETHSTDPGVSRALKKMLPHLVSKKQLQAYEQLDPANARLRTLMDYTLGNNEWKLLWMPPSLPYVMPGKELAGIDHITKSIVFSSWSVVPDVIAATCSYTVERKRVLSSGREDYFELNEKRKALLKFKQTDGEPDSMSSLLLLCPSPWLVELVDPLQLAMQNNERPLSAGEQLSYVSNLLAEDSSLDEKLPERQTAREDANWYWASIALTDLSRSRRFAKWSADSEGWRSALDSDDDRSAPSAFTAHVDWFREADRLHSGFGTPPHDLHDLLAGLALGSPTICAARSLLRIAPDLNADDPAVLSAALKVGEGFRSLFNAPDVRSFLETESAPYWQRVLRYCQEANLQAVLDEYFHFLKEALGLFDKPGDEVVAAVSAVAHDVLSIRTSSLTLEEFSTTGRNQFSSTPFKMRCRYALRFADIKDDSDKVLLRAGVVRDAFNSPFRPFILATTSIGQEGLDFHGYCHRVWHWNLPRNPVDMEQREGRVNRYKGHAVRKNVARRVGLAGLRENWNSKGDPWLKLFDVAKNHLRSNGTHHSDLTPFWLYDDVNEPSMVERLVPLPPFSSENSRLELLKHNLTVYRLAFGQPRQQDLLDYLALRGVEITPEILRELQLDLAPRA